MEVTSVSNLLSVRSKLHDYEVFFNKDIISIIEELSKNGSFFAVDANINRLYPQIRRALPESRTIVIEPSEENKSLDKCKDLMELLVQKRIRRDNTLVAIGGGIVQDVTAFTA